MLYNYTVVDRIMDRLDLSNLPTIEQLAKIVQEECATIHLELTCELLTACLYHTDKDECKKMDSFNRLKEIIGF